MVKYELLAQRLKLRLLEMPASGGAKLPALMTIAKQESCSLNTVQRAIDELKKEGLIVTRAGHGTFLASAYAAKTAPAKGETALTSGRPLRLVVFSGLFSALMKDPIGCALFKGLEEILAKDGHPIQYHNVQVRGRPIPLSSEVLEQRVCGTICLSPFNNDFLAQLAMQCKPLVSVDRDATSWGVSSIVLDNTAGALLAASRLMDLGHRRIAYLGASETGARAAGHDPAVEERAQGFMLAHLARDLKPSTEICLPIEDRTDISIERALLELLKLRKAGRKFTALLAYDENFARIALRGLQAAGIRVPAECSVVSAGSVTADGPIGGALYDVSKIAARAWQLLQESGCERVVLPPRFEGRDTLAPPA